MMAYGQVNADVIGTSVAGSNLGAGNASLMKSRIINGAMVIDQRNAGASTTSGTNNGYTLDRWATQNNSGASRFTVQRNAGSITPPAGFSNYLGCTSTGSYTVGSGDAIGMIQRIEGYNIADLGWGAANAKTVTLSFWVYSSLTGTFGGSLFNGNGNYSYPFTYSITSANTWQQISVTFTGPTSGSFANDNSTGLNVLFALGTGSSLSGTAGAWGSANYLSATGATSVVGTNGATFYITGAQLEVGSSATGFEYRLYNQELLACQRYFQSFGGSNSYGRFAIGQAYNSTNAQVVFFLKTTMRSSPSYSQTGAGDANLSNSAVSGLLVSGVAIDAADPNCTSVTVTVSGGGLSAGNATQYYARNSTAVFATFSAEL
jgi:hypothetical protein